MKKFKPFKLSFSYALKKAFNYWSRGVLQVQNGEIGSLYNENYGRCAIGCALPMDVIRKAKEKDVADPAGLKRKGLIKSNDIRKLTKLMQAHDSGEKGMRDFFVKHKLLKR